MSWWDRDPSLLNLPPLAEALVGISGDRTQQESSIVPVQV
jgi:hypothetical protein